MSTDHRLKLTQIKRFDQLIAYLRDEMGWPIARDSFDDVDDLFYEFSAEELGIDPKTSAKILEIKRLRPLSPKQPWGIFFVKFEPKKLPVIALRRILGQVALKRRASANSPDRTAWSADDLLFISNYGDGDARQISFAHFSKSESSLDLPTLRVLGWNNLDTGLHLDAVAKELTENLIWPEEGGDLNQWRKSWSDAFKLGHNEVINTAKDLSIRLAELASSIRDRIKVVLSIENDSGPLTILMSAFKSTLVNDLDGDSFADMYAQTITYGLLSARITDPSKKTVDDFTSHMRTSPFLRELMETFLKIGGRKGKAGGPGIDFDELGVGDVIQLLDNVNIEAVLRDFGDKNRQEDPVMHFFEGFLQAYDKKIRKDRGVFYTPQPVVSYIVRSVHELLQTEFGLVDGLADTTTWGEMLEKHQHLSLPRLTDSPTETKTISPLEPFVQILDPATGTATFLVEVIDVIYNTLSFKWKHARLTVEQQLNAWNEYVPNHLLPRLHAYELMMAPYAIAHMKIGLKLAETGYRFGNDVRARIYLTNALETWVNQLSLIGFDALAHEASAVNEIKQHKRFTVVLGNPPYSGESKNKGEHILALMDTYKKEPNGSKLNEKNSKWINDDYVKFYRLSHQAINLSGVGFVAFITNHSWIDNPTFRGMRSSLMNDFESISIVDLHGNVKKKERTPEFFSNQGLDKNVFDIEQGVLISFLTKNNHHKKHGFKIKNSSSEDSEGRSLPREVHVHHSELWGSREFKYDWLNTKNIQTTPFKLIKPALPLLLFVPRDEVLATSYEMWWSVADILRTHGTGIVTKCDELNIHFDKAECYSAVKFFVSVSEVEARSRFRLPAPQVRDWKFEIAQEDIRSTKTNPNLIRKISYRPFDFRSTYYTGNSRGVMGWPVYKVMRSLLDDQIFLATCRQVKSGNWSHVLIGSGLAESCYISNRTSEIATIMPLWNLIDGKPVLNINPKFLQDLSNALGMSLKSDNENYPNSINPENVIAYIYAVLHSPSYRIRYGEMLKSDFPRVPLPSAEGSFSFSIWQDLVALGAKLIDLHLFRKISNNSCATFTVLGNNKVEKPYFEINGNDLNGRVWINSTQFFDHIATDTWNYQVGAYQVCEKWLKDRKGRVLDDDEIQHYQNVVASLTETISNLAKIDKVIDKFGGWPDAFQTKKA